MVIILSVYGLKTSNNQKLSIEDVARRQQSFLDWLRHCGELYSASLKRLQSPVIIHYIHYLKNGSYSILPCCMKLWTAFDGTIPDGTTDPSLYGLMWLPLPAKFKETPFLPDFNSLNLRTISFFDITNISVEIRSGLGERTSNPFPASLYCIPSGIAAAADGSETSSGKETTRSNNGAGNSRRKQSGSINPSVTAFQSHVCNGRTDIVMRIQCQYGNYFDFLLCCLHGISASDSKVIEAKGWQLVDDLRSIVNYIDVNNRIYHSLKSRSSVIKTGSIYGDTFTTSSGLGSASNESLTVSVAVARVEHKFQH
jgi:hypothetical protein